MTALKKRDKTVTEVDMPDKSRYFTFLVYPESAPEGWIDKLEETGFPMAISPLHDKDLDKNLMEKRDDGEIIYKKAHYHVLLVLSNTFTAGAVRKKIQRALGSESKNTEISEKAKKAIALVQIVRTSVENTYLYLTHESKTAKKEEKHVYPKEELKHLNQFDISRYTVFDVDTKAKLFEVICNLIVEHQLCNIIRLKRYLEIHGIEYGLDIKTFNSIVQNKVGLLRLYFDASYQEMLRRANEKSDETRN